MYPLEIIWTILHKLDYNTILAYCQTSKLAANILNTKVFWIQKLEQDHIFIDKLTFIDTPLSPRQRYLQLLTENNGLAKGSEKFISSRCLMRRAIRQERKDIEEYLINLGFDDWSLILEEYAIMNDIDSLNHYLLSSQNYDIVAYGALIGGHKDLFNMARHLSFDQDWNLYVAGSLRSNKIDLFTYVLLLMPDYVIDWQQLCESLVSLRNRISFDYIRLLVPDYDFNWLRLGYMASLSNDLDFFDYVRSLTSFDIHKWEMWICGAIESNNRKMFDHICTLGKSNWKYNWNKFLSRALLYDRIEMFKYITTIAPEDYIINWDLLMSNAINSRNPFIIKYFLSISHEIIIDWNEVLVFTMNLRCKILFEQVLKLVPDSVVLNWKDITRRATNYLGEI